MRLWGKAAFAAVLALGLTAAGRAQEPTNPLLPTTGTREISFSGNLQFEPVDDFNVQIGYGPFLNPNLQVGGQIQYSDPDGGSSYYALGAFANYHFPSASPLLPYAGVFLGYVDGDGIDGDVAYGLQGGVKYFLNSSVSVFGELTYRDGDGPSSTGLNFGLNVYLR